MTSTTQEAALTVTSRHDMTYVTEAEKLICTPGCRVVALKYRLTVEVGVGDINNSL